MTDDCLQKLLKTMAGRRVTGVYCPCCHGDEAVLRQRWCKDELELFCDRCETWIGERITIADLGDWMLHKRRVCKYPLYTFEEAGNGTMDRDQVMRRLFLAPA
jgi:hypothetical protein